MWMSKWLLDTWWRWSRMYTSRWLNSNILLSWWTKHICWSGTILRPIWMYQFQFLVCLFWKYSNCWFCRLWRMSSSIKRGMSIVVRRALKRYKSWLIFSRMVALISSITLLLTHVVLLLSRLEIKSASKIRFKYFQCKGRLSFEPF